MKKAILKDFYREIKYTLNRYLSILFIVALGVAFFSGIRATAPDMKQTLDYYLDTTGYMDIRVLSTLGLTDEDISALADIEGVAAVESSYTYDAYVMRGDERRTLHFLSEPEQINCMDIVDGRAIQADDECIVDAFMADKYGYAIGDVLSVVDAEDKPVSDTLTRDTYTIVGVATSSSYFTVTRDSTSIGKGETDAFVYLSKNVFLSEVYSAAYIHVSDAVDEIAFSDAYQDLVDEVVDRLEAISDEREAARYDGIMDDANEELDKARTELADAKAEAESELADARTKIEDGERELADGRTELAQKRSDYETQIADARAMIADGEQELRDGEKTIKNNEKKLKDGEAQIKTARETLNAGEKELKAKRADYEAGLAQAEEGQAKLDDGYEQLAAAEETIRQQENELLANKEVLLGQRAELEQGLSELDAGIAYLEEQKAELERQLDAAADKDTSGDSEGDGADNSADSGDSEGEGANRSEIEYLKDQLETLELQLAELRQQREAAQEGLNQVNSGLDQVNGGLQQIADGQTELDAQKKNLDEQQAILTATFTELEQAEEQLTAAESTLKSGKKELDAKSSEINKGKKELKNAKAEVSDGWQKLEDSRKELDSQMADAEVQFADAEAELADGEQKLADAREEYASGKQEADEKIADAEREIADAEAELADIEYPEWHVLDRNSTQGYVEYEQNAERINAIGRVFPLIFFLVAALISLTTMTRMVESQRTQIGTLKALGYGTWAIARKYVLYALSASAIGSVIGIIFGQKFLPWLIITTYKVLYPNLPVILTPLNLYYSILSSAAAILCVTLAAFSACYKALMAPAADLMRPAAPKIGRKIWLEHIGFIWRRLRFTSKVAMRNLFRYKKRFFMTIFGIGGCTALVIFGFGLTDSISGVVDRQYSTLFHYDLTINLEDNVSSEDLKLFTDYLEGAENVEDYIFVRSRSMELQGDEASYLAYLTVPEEGAHYSDFVHLQSRKTGESYELNDDGVIITEKLADLLQVKPGDTMAIKDNDKTVEVRVAHITENYILSYIYMTPELYTQVFGESPKWNAVQAFIPGLTDEEAERMTEEMLALNAVAGTTTTSGTRQKFDDVLGSLDVITLVVIVAAGMLAFIVLYNLNNINITERRRELATIKVLGFFDMEVAEYVYRENIMLTLIGVVIGIFFGKYLHSFIITTVETDILMFIRQAKISSYIWSVLVTFGFSMFVNWMMYYRLKKIDMVESLKSVE